MGLLLVHANQKEVEYDKKKLFMNKIIIKYSINDVCGVGLAFNCCCGPQSSSCMTTV